MVIKDVVDADRLFSVTEGEGRWQSWLRRIAGSYRLGRARDTAGALARRFRRGGAKAHRVPLAWRKRPVLAPSGRVCLFVLLPRDGRVMPHSVDHALAWRAAGYAVVAIVVVASLDEQVDLAPLAEMEGLIVRANRGYDFGAWAATIHALGSPLRDTEVVALANDSVLGPSARFAAMVERAERCEVDVVGLVASAQVRLHLQSFVLFFKRDAVRAPVFATFWARVRSGDRDYVIARYETRLTSVFSAAGLRTAALFAAASSGNPTLDDWRALIEGGFPYLKVQLLRDNPTGASLDGWRALAERSGFDMGRIDGQIGALERSARVGWRVREAAETVAVGPLPLEDE